MEKPKLKNLPDLSGHTRPGTQIAVRITPKAAGMRLIQNEDGLRAAGDRTARKWQGKRGCSGAPGPGNEGGVIPSGLVARINA